MRTILTVTDQVKIVARGEAQRAKILDILDDEGTIQVGALEPVGAKSKRGKKKEEAEDETAEVSHISVRDSDPKAKAKPAWFVFAAAEKIAVNGKEITITHQ